MKVLIDGVEYVPKATVISEQAMKNLAEAYSLAFGYGKYDPEPPPVGNILSRVWDLLHEANKELEFRR